MSYYEIELAYRRNITASVIDICQYVKDYVKTLEANRTGCNVGWGKWTAIQLTSGICYKFYASAKYIISAQITDNCVVDLGDLAQLYLGDLNKLGLLHDPADDDVDLMAKVRTFEVTIAESTRIYLKQLPLSDGQLAYLTYKVDQVEKINQKVKRLSK